LALKEIGALLRLVDDPDQEVFDTVATRLLLYGREIIPSLEQLWEMTANESVQERIELLIHRVHFNDLQHDLMEWSRGSNPDLLRGAILVAKFQFPGLDEQDIYNRFEQMRRNIWLELNNYLTPIEQVHVFNSILYSYYKLQGHELTEREPKHFFINQVMESRQGNAYAIGVLYLALCDPLDIPIFAVNIPRQFILAYIDSIHSFLNFDKEGIHHIPFYIDPISGITYTQKDVDSYLKKINAYEREFYFSALPARQVIYKMMEELSLCYRYRREEQKADEVILLMQIISMNGMG
jgi:hypothetical protein